ncbi:MAG: hypothetical protein U0638_14880 [Phycisphaerales bacterium]
MGAFLLDKWYFDVVDEDGRAAIVHAAVLRYGLIHLHYGAILASTAPATKSTTHSAIHHATIRAGDMPLTSARGTSWTCNSLDLSINCSPVPPNPPHPTPIPPPHRLLENDDGFIDWGPIHQHASVDLRTPDFAIRGLGYAERLTMTLRPWDMPIDAMHWGRWIGTSSSMVWLCWEGPVPKTLVLLNEPAASDSDDPHDAGSANKSTESTDSSVTPGLIKSRHASLSLSNSRSLRDESLADSLLSIIPGLRSWAPARTLAAHERRWLSRGTLTRPDHSAEQGWAIHEEVRFDGSSPRAGENPHQTSDPPSAGVP